MAGERDLHVAGLGFGAGPWRLLAGVLPAWGKAIMASPGGGASGTRRPSLLWRPTDPVQAPRLPAVPAIPLLLGSAPSLAQRPETADPNRPMTYDRGVWLKHLVARKTRAPALRVRPLLACFRCCFPSARLAARPPCSCRRAVAHHSVVLLFSCFYSSSSSSSVFLLH